MMLEETRVRTAVRRAARAAAVLCVVLWPLSGRMGSRAFAGAVDAGEMAANLTERMKSDLGLSDDQVGRVERINLDALNKMQALLEERAASAQAAGGAAGSSGAATAGAGGGSAASASGAAGGEARATGQALGGILKERETALRGVLTPAQLQTLQAHRAKWTAALETQAMTMELGLSDDQAKKVESINLKATEKMQSILSGPPPTLPRQKLARGRELRAAADERDKGLKSVLTPDQWTAYEAKRDERREMLKDRMEQGRP